MPAKNPASKLANRLFHETELLRIVQSIPSSPRVIPNGKSILEVRPLRRQGSLFQQT